VIASFADKATSDLFHGVDSKEARRVPKEIWGVVRRKLDMVNAAHAAKDLKVPPGNRLEALKGNLAGRFSIRVNDQYRVVFRFENGNASHVQVMDYH
jgi:proteic killer suppression protein